MRGQKGGLRDFLITKKIINFNIKKKKKIEEDEIKSKKDESSRLKKINELIEIKNNDNPILLRANKIIDLTTSKKGVDTDISVLKDAVVINNIEDTDVVYEPEAEPIITINKSEVKKVKASIKKGIDQTETEIAISNKVNVIIKKAKEEISEVSKEVIKIEDDIQKEGSTEKVSEYEQKLIKIEKKVTDLKRKYSIILENTDFTNFDELSDEALLDEISNYKFIVDESEMVSDLAKTCKKEIDKMATIIDVYEQKKNVNKKLQLKKQELEKRDEEFENHKQKTKKIGDVNEQIRSNFEAQNEFIRNLQYKLSKMEDKYQDEFKLKGLKIMSYNLFKMSFLIYAIKNKRIGLLIGGIVLDNTIKIMNNNFIERQMQSTYLKYKELNENLYNQKDDLEYIGSLLNDSLNQTEKLKEEFKYKFQKYQDVLPEYNYVFKKLDMVIEQLREKDEEIKRTEEAIEKQVKKNKVKIKRMDVYNNGKY
jgi:hypothetical protein